jgi:hypothetical protein
VEGIGGLNDAVTMQLNEVKDALGATQRQNLEMSKMMLELSRRMNSAAT